MIIKTSDLTGPALDWAVAKCEGFEMRAWRTYKRLNRVDFSTQWDLAGPIIERECIDLESFGAASEHPKNPDGWDAVIYLRDEHVSATGPTPLVAAMRCYVASKMGEYVEVPEELA